MTQATLQPLDLTGDHGGMVELLDEREDRSPSRTSRLADRVRRPFVLLWAAPNALTYAGVLVAAIGAVLLVIAWGRTAGLTNVALQVPYVVSAGLTGIGLVATGLTIVNVAAKKADAQERRRQTTELRDLLTELRRVVEEDRS